MNNSIINNYTKNTFYGTFGALVTYGIVKALAKGAAAGVAVLKLKRAAKKAARELEEEETK